MRIFLDDNTEREFQLPAGFSMELSRTNPFLTDEGSQSIPITLPPTDHNLRLVGAIHRGVWTHRPVRRLLVRVQHGAVNMRGSLAIDSAHRKEGIGCTFYTSEGQLYETIGEKLLGDLEWPVKTIAGGVTARIAELKQVMNDANGFDYWIFPVLSDNYIQRTGYEGGGKFLLNETISLGNTPSDVYFVGEEERDWVSDDGDKKQIISLPIGYGISPFLKISYLIRFIFGQFGYNVPENIFDTNVSLRQLVLLNNTADAICDAGTLSYRQLVPEQTGIMDFINMLRRKFGVEFIERGEDIVVRLWNQAIDDLPNFDFSSFVNKDFSIDFVDPKAISIAVNRSLEPYATVEGNSVQDMRNKFKEYLNFSTSTGRYYFMVVEYEFGRPNHVRRYVSSSFWDKKTQNELPAENIEFLDFSTPMAEATGTVYGTDDQRYIYYDLPFVGLIRNANTVVSMNDTNKKEKEEELTDLSMMLCFSIPGWQYIFSTHYIIKMGSSFKYKMYRDEMWGVVSLTATGESNLYDLFYRRRDDMLQHANQIVKFEARLLPEEIVAMDLSVPKVVDGIKILVERIDYVLGQPDICQVTARTLHEFDDS